MKTRAKLEANDKREAIFERDEYRCHHCGGSIYAHGTPMLAHKISKGKSNIAKYGREIIFHPLNMLSCCSLGICNDSAMLHGPIAREALIDEIIEDLKLREL